MPVSTLSHTLPIGYMLNDRYLIDSILGEGGFGITYKAVDTINSDTNHYVAIKEYYPSGIAARSFENNNLYYVTHFDGKLAVSFRKGLDRFRQEAFLLKEFSNLESIVSVLDIFDELGTTYIVMEYIEGLTIQKLVKKDGPLAFSELINLIKPLLKDMSLIHQHGLIHRDISPDNLLIGMDNNLHLIDFGSANHSNINASKTYTVILKAGYAPPEQYIPNGRMGSWTDVYGISATIYYALTGHPPMDSLQRMQQDTHNEIISEQLRHISGLEDYQRDAILQGLSLSIKDRYPSVSILLNALTTPPEDDRITEIHPHTAKSSVPYKIKPGLAIGCLVVLCVSGYIIVSYKGIPGNSVHTQDTSRLESNYMVNETDNSDNTTSYDNNALSDNTVLSESMALSDDTTSYSDSDNTHGTENDTRTGYNNDNTSAAENTGLSNYSPNILTMVNFSGWSIYDAISYLSAIDSGIQIHTIYEYSNTYSKGQIITQSIQPNTQFTKGSIANIVFTVSDEKKPEQNVQASSDNNNSNNTVSSDKSSSSGKSTNNTGKSSSSSRSDNSSDSNDGYTVIHIGD